MKIRKGFVSNSSSSSFLIYGTSFDEYEGDAFEELQKKLGKTFLDFQTGEEGYNQYVGLSWHSIKDDETGKQFKDRIEAEIKRLFSDKKIKCGIHEEAWRDG